MPHPGLNIAALSRRTGVAPDTLRRYARAAEAVAEADVDVAVAAPDLSHMLQTVVVGTVMIDPVLASLRRLAQQHVTTGRLD